MREGGETAPGLAVAADMLVRVKSSGPGQFAAVRGNSQEHRITASSGIFFMLQRKFCARSAPARSAAGAAAQRREAPTGAAQRREAPPQAAEQRAPCKVRFCAGNFRIVSFAE